MNYFWNHKILLPNTFVTLFFGKCLGGYGFRSKYFFWVKVNVANAVGIKLANALRQFLA